MKTSSPYDRGWPIGRVDQGVDNSTRHVGPLYAIANAVVSKVDPVGASGWGGMGAVYYKFSEGPIVMSGRSYRAAYSAETGLILAAASTPGNLLTAGQEIAVTVSGWQESGFANDDGTGPHDPDIRLHGSTLPTQAGYDYLRFVQAQLAAPTLTVATERFLWAAWELGEGLFEPYGRRSLAHRPPEVRARIPAAWWTWLAAFLARRRAHLTVNR